jgi:TatD DNase family protein
MRLIDTHSHVSDPDFDRDRDDVLARALDASVTGLLNVATEPNSWSRYLDLAEGREGQAVALGFHPNCADTFSEDECARLRRMLEENRGKAVAVGETGLDFFRDYCGEDEQRRAFEAQLALSAELDLPFILHCRKAEREMCDMLKSHRERLGRPLKGVWHCFSATVDFMKEAVGLGLHLGLGGVLTYPKAGELREAARQAPPDRLLLETDAPYLPPQPWRGRRNEPAYVAETARRLGEVRGVSAEEIGRITSGNARRLFGCWQPRLRG